jgi:hypothetical protein
VRALKLPSTSIPEQCHALRLIDNVWLEKQSFLGVVDRADSPSSRHWPPASPRTRHTS